MLSPHLFMNFRVVDEHGRQLGTGRNLGALKAELGVQARGAFQALAGLKPALQAEPVAAVAAQQGKAGQAASRQPSAGQPDVAVAQAGFAAEAGQRHAAWDFGAVLKDARVSMKLGHAYRHVGTN